MNLNEIEKTLKRTNAKIKKIEKKQRKYRSALLFTGIFSSCVSLGFLKSLNRTPFYCDEKNEKRIEYLFSNNCKDFTTIKGEAVPSYTDLSDCSASVIYKSKWKNNGDRIERNISEYVFDGSSLDDILEWIEEPETLQYNKQIVLDTEYSDFVPYINKDDYFIYYPNGFVFEKRKQTDTENLQDLYLFLIFLTSFSYLSYGLVEDTFLKNYNHGKMKNQKKNLLEEKKILEELYLQNIEESAKEYALELRNRKMGQL